MFWVKPEKVEVGERWSVGNFFLGPTPALSYHKTVASMYQCKLGNSLQHLIPQRISLRLLALQVLTDQLPEKLNPLIIFALQHHIHRSAKQIPSLKRRLDTHVTQVIRRQEIYTLKSIKF